MATSNNQIQIKQDIIKLASLINQSRDAGLHLSLDELVDDKISRLFELMVCLKFAENIKEQGYSIELVCGPNSNEYRFPRNPGMKSNFAYFQVTDKNNIHIADVCFGTKITCKYGNLVSPDISVQDPKSGGDPKKEHIFLIMDAKHHKNSNKPMTKQDVSGFQSFINALDLKTLKTPPFFWNIYKSPANLLISNANFSTAKIDELVDFSIGEIASYSNHEKGLASRP